MAGRDNKRIQRVFSQKPLRVLISSIGSDVKYELSTQNLSTQEIFLNFDKPGRLPFTKASILEVWIELSSKKILFFNGKIARIVFSEDEDASTFGPGLGIRIILASDDNQETFDTFLDDNSETETTNLQAS